VKLPNGFPAKIEDQAWEPSQSERSGQQVARQGILKLGSIPASRELRPPIWASAPKNDNPETSASDCLI